MLIEEYSEDIELVVIEITVAGKQIRVMSGYGPQECWPVEKRMTFFQALEKEGVKAEMASRSIILYMDANSKLGTEHILEIRTRSQKMVKFWKECSNAMPCVWQMVHKGRSLALSQEKELQKREPKRCN